MGLYHCRHRHSHHIFSITLADFDAVALKVLSTTCANPKKSVSLRGNSRIMKTKAFIKRATSCIKWSVSCIKWSISCVIGVLCAMLIGCDETHYSRTTTTSTWDSVMLTAHIQFYGQYYPNIQQNVMSLDLLSKGLEYDSLYHITGSGTNVYLSDVFIPLMDSMLVSNIYTIDTTAAAYTIITAVDCQPGLTGAYAIRIQNSVVVDTLMFTRGEMLVEQWNDSLRLEMNLFTADSVSWKGWFETGNITIDK